MKNGLLAAIFRQVATHPVAVVMFSVAALVFGWVSYQRLAVELMPDIAYPTITVRTVFDGAAPQEVETQVSRPVEEALATLDGLVTIESRSRAGSSDVVLGFDWGTDMGAAVQTIRENLQTTWLPEETDRPLILRYDPSLDPFLRVAVSFDPAHPPVDTEQGLYTLREIADREIKRDLEAMDGVAAVRVTGGLEREIRVEVREDWLAARGIRLEQVSDALAAENINVAGGTIMEGDTEFLVRTLNEFRTVDELRAVRIRRADGVTVPLTDVANVFESHREREVVSHLDGVEAVELEVFKEADANVVDVARQVKERLFGGQELSEQQIARMESMGVPIPETGGLRGTLPEGIALEVLDDQAAFIEAAVSNLRNAAILGGMLAVMVLFLFLRDFRATAIIGLAIPVSVVCGFGPLYLGGVSLNLMSLGGLALGVGMLVDNAVVVLESIQRYREDGQSRIDAAVNGVSAVAAAVTASTLTTVAVFFPITFVEGVAGELFGDLSIAVVASLMASLVVALFLVPTLAALEMDGGTAALAREGTMGALTQPTPGRAVLEAVVVEPTDQLRDSLAWARERWWRRPLVGYFAVRYAGHLLVREVMVVGMTVSGVVGRLAARLMGFATGLGGGALLWIAGRFQSRYGRLAKRYQVWLGWTLGRTGTVLLISAALFLVSLHLMPLLGSELLPEVHQGRFVVEATLPVGTPLQRTQAVMARAEDAVSGHPYVEAVYTKVGADRRADTDADEGPHSARMRVRLAPGGDLASREEAVIEDLRRRLHDAVPELEIHMSRPALFSVEQPVEVVVFGWDLGELRTAGDEVAARLGGMEGVADVQSSLVRGHPEVLVRYDRDLLARFGLDPGTVARRVRGKVQGVEATRIRRGEDRIDLRVQLVEEDRATLTDLEQININPSLVPPIPLVAVADLTEAEGPSEIRRVDQQRAVVVSANLEGFDLGSVSQRIEKSLATLDLPPDLTWTVAGQSTEMRKSMGSLQFALLLAVFLVYVTRRGGGEQRDRVGGHHQSTARRGEGADRCHLCGGAPPASAHPHHHRDHRARAAPVGARVRRRC
ncbi:MAG: efflux RND transporter permease subunit [Deltaproteobacteria bacterium]|nr:efflux RND transporter permease subunit [Deltaproteobacteria bacterium]